MNTEQIDLFLNIEDYDLDYISTALLTSLDGSDFTADTALDQENKLIAILQNPDTWENVGDQKVYEDFYYGLRLIAMEQGAHDAMRIVRGTQQNEENPHEITVSFGIALNWTFNGTDPTPSHQFCETAMQYNVISDGVFDRRKVMSSVVFDTAKIIKAEKVEYLI